MRILEICTTAWPQPDMQKQIDALREAFSADTTRPFELKPSFPYGSPGVPARPPSPPMEAKYQGPTVSRHQSFGNISHQMPFQSGLVTPPMTAGLDSTHKGSSDHSSGSSFSNGQHPSMGDMQAAWNPTPIFEYVGQDWMIRKIDH